MKNWQVHQLVETLTDGTKRALGGAIVDLTIFPGIGALNELSVTPVDEETMQSEFWVNEHVLLQVADRKVWLDPEETQTLIDLLQTALAAAKENVSNK